MPTIGAKSKIFQLRILSEWQWREQNQAIHRGYLYFKSRTIYTQDIYAFELILKSIWNCHYHPFSRFMIFNLTETDKRISSSGKYFVQVFSG